MSPWALLFDLDGVLVRTYDAWFQVVSEAGRRFRGRPIPREEFDPTFGQGTAADVAGFGLSCTPAELDAFYAEQFAKFSSTVWINPEARPTVEALRARGLKLAVVTNTVSAIVPSILRAGGLLELFDVLACADLVAHAKPAPDLVLYALDKLNILARDAWMVGDTRFDRQAAHGAGVRFVGLGIDGDARIESLSELTALVHAASLRS